jgi:hypothetical protein
MFGEDLQAHIQVDVEDKKRVTAGVNGSAHSREYEVLTDSKETGWITLRLVGGDDAQDHLSTKWSIVLDAEDQRMQLAPIAPLRGVVQLELCLLTMEEDEAGDGEGFTLVLREEEDDEHFICLEERFFHALRQKRESMAILVPSQLTCQLPAVADWASNVPYQRGWDTSARKDGGALLSS